MRGTAQCSLRVRTLSSNGLRGSWQDWYREVLVQVGIAEAICTNAHLGFRGNAGACLPAWWESDY